MGEEQGVEDSATITVRISDVEVLPENSVLRQSIQKNGGSSYYYAHANEKDLPPDLRYVYGGEPTKLGEAERSVEETAKPASVIEKYAWADEGEFVCIYIAADNESQAVTAAKDGKSNEVSVDFSAK